MIHDDQVYINKELRTVVALPTELLCVATQGGIETPTNE